MKIDEDVGNVSSTAVQMISTATIIWLEVWGGASVLTVIMFSKASGRLCFLPVAEFLHAGSKTSAGPEEKRSPTGRRCKYRQN